MTCCDNNCKAHETLRMNLIGEIGENSGRSTGRSSICRKKPQGQAGAYLLDCRGSSGSGAFSIGTSRTELADFLCANRSALSRELRRMKEEGLIEILSGVFRIADEDGLKRGVTLTETVITRATRGDERR
jgi:CRP-like cAMP-binding protein